MRSLANVVRFVSDMGRPSLRGVIAALQKTSFTVAESTRPLYRRSRPAPQDPEKTGNDTNFIDLTNIKVPSFTAPDGVAAAVGLFDARAAAAIGGAVGTINVDALHFVPGGPGGGHFVPFDAFGELVETKKFGEDASDVVIPIAQSLAVIAYPDFFPGVHDELSRRMVSEAILVPNPGWCGTFGPGVDDAFDLALGDPAED